MKFYMFILALVLCVVLCTSLTTTGKPKRYRSKRPSRKSNQVVRPPISCPDLYEASADAGDFGPLIRKTQHNTNCKQYFECVTNRWLARDCPDGTTFNSQEKGCDSSKACLPKNLPELYLEGVEELKDFLGIGDKPDI